MKYIFVSQTTLPYERRALERFGRVAVLPAHQSLPEPISSHPDTLFAVISGTIFTYGDYDASFLDELDIKCVKTEAAAGKTYPADAALNCFELSGALFCRKKSLSPQITGFAEQNGLCIAGVNQGYAHCASAVLAGGLISSDSGIISQAQTLGIPSLEISRSGVSLDGYACGFIGGACAQIDNTAVFFGDPDSHPDSGMIKEFVSSRGLDVLPLSQGGLRDCGGILIIDNENILEITRTL